MSIALEQHILKVIDVPTYFTRYVNNKINLIDTPSICCPFHNEDTPSFNYSVEKRIWSCFGSCKTGGDVINMHRKQNNMRSRDEAIVHLAAILKIDRRDLGFVAPDYDNYISKKMAEYRGAMAIAGNRARTAEDYLELDYLVSFNKDFDEMIEDLNEFNNRNVSKTFH